MALRVGTDLVSTASVAAALRDHAEAYLGRVYTPAEVRDCTGPHGPEAHRLAARFAAKEATMKVLRPKDLGIPWAEIEVCRHPDGWVALALHGSAAARAEEAGVQSLEVSITHEDELASAVVIAEIRSNRR